MLSKYQLVNDPAGLQQGHQFSLVKTITEPQVHTLIPVVARFICSQKGKAHKISKLLLRCLKSCRSLSCSTLADEEPGCG